jgi:hypothetical protein
MPTIVALVAAKGTSLRVASADFRARRDRPVLH